MTLKKNPKPLDKRAPSLFDVASDLIGGIDDASMPRDLSARTKHYLKKWGYGKKKRRP